MSLFFLSLLKLYFSECDAVLKYKNAKTMLPAWLLDIVQDYVQGEIIYIPKEETVRIGWGAANGAREKYRERNVEIVGLYRNGAAIHELSLKYNLSEDSIRKIINGMRGIDCKFEVVR
jgi:Mor family transcriptional regulator